MTNRPRSSSHAVIGRMAVRAATACLLLVLLCSVTIYGAPSSRVSDDALRNISETLLANDINNAAEHIRINYQSRTDSNSAIDDAPDPLLTVAPEALNISTVSILRKTFDNYIADTRVNEQITDEEMNEENDLLDAFIATPVMEHTASFLTSYDFLTRDPNALKNLLRELWFSMYSRSGDKIGSSGFEHVFLGELKKGKVSGMHNWIFFTTEEAKNSANYMGYLKKLELGEKGDVVKIHYKWSNAMKPVGSMFVGTSPEFEMALYTICFLARPNGRCKVTLGNKGVTIRIHTSRSKEKNVIGSAFPEI